MATTINPAQLSISQPAPNSAKSSIPTTPSSSAPTEAGSGSKKRKSSSWGAPIGEIKRIIGPRKRAKTEEEKVQRQKERTLRNRRAAEASRQRKAEQYNLIELQRNYLQDLVTKFIEQNTSIMKGVQERHPEFKLPDNIKFDVFMVHQRPEETIKSEAQKKKDYQTSATDDNQLTCASPLQTTPITPPKSQSPKDSPALTVLDDMNSSVGNPSLQNTPATTFSDDFGDTDMNISGQVTSNVEFASLFDGEPGDLPARYLIPRLHARLSKRSNCLMNLLFRLVFR
jgi:hypothetical protein